MDLWSVEDEVVLWILGLLPSPGQRFVHPIQLLLGPLTAPGTS
jgi:hypothetical protein